MAPHNRYNPGGVDFNLQVKVEKNGTRLAVQALCILSSKLQVNYEL